MPVTEDDADFRLVSEAAPIRELTRLVSTTASEARIHLSEDGVEVSVVDPANVMTMSATFGAEAFETVEAPGGAAQEPLTIGTQVKYLAGAASKCRFSRNDTFELRYDSERAKCSTAVHRADDPLSRVQTFGLISPKTIREEPDIPEFQPAEDDKWGRFKMDPKTLRDTLKWTLGGESDYIKFDHEGDDFRATCGFGGVEMERVGTVSDTLLGTEPSGPSLFSGDYISDLASGLKSSRMERAEVRLSEDFPVKVVLTNQEWDATAGLMVAPRIQGT